MTGWLLSWTFDHIVYVDILPTAEQAVTAMRHAVLIGSTDVYMMTVRLGPRLQECYQ